MGSALGLKPSVGKAEEEAADKGEKVLGRAVWRREHMRRQPEADQTASPLRRHPTCKHPGTPRVWASQVTDCSCCKGYCHC